MNIVKVKSQKELTNIMESMLANEVFYNPDGVQTGYIDSIEILDKITKEKKPFAQVQFNITSADGKHYNKRYSVDFTGKYMRQLGITAAESVGCMVVFKPTGKYKNVGWWAFVSVEVTEDNLSYYDIIPYTEEVTEDLAARLKKLGI